MSEEFVRLVAIVPLAFTTLQVVGLWRMLPSRAWMLIAGGFVVFLLLMLAGALIPFDIRWRLGISLVGYALVAVGFRMLRSDLRSALRKKK